MGKAATLLTTAGVGLSALAVGAASPPNVLSQVRGGLWEFTGLPGARPARLCVAHPPMLAQVEHRSARCTRTVLRNDATSAVIEYRCAGGGFGHSEITMLTPRSIRIETQGIAAQAPFHYVAQARRVGDCRGH